MSEQESTKASTKAAPVEDEAPAEDEPGIGAQTLEETREQLKAAEESGDVALAEVLRQKVTDLADAAGESEKASR